MRDLQLNFWESRTQPRVAFPVTLRGREFEPRQKPPCRDTGSGLQGALRTHNVCFSPGAGAEAGEGRDSRQGLGLPLHAASPQGNPCGLQALTEKGLLEGGEYAPTLER